MPLLERTHDEPGGHYIVQVPNTQYSGKRLGVTFVEGEGRTKSREKAIRFSDVYGYDVMRPTGTEGWEIPHDPHEDVEFGTEWELEGAAPVAIEEEDDEPVAQKGRRASRAA